MKIGFILVSLFLLLALSLPLGALVDPDYAQLPVIPAQISPSPTPASCEQSMIQAVETNGWGAPTYTDTLDGGAWTLHGIAGTLREWQWDFYRDGPVFDLVQVYYHHEPIRYPLWAAVGVTLPAYYSVHDAASLEYYKLHGYANQPYYVSFVEGAETRQEVLALLSQPGQRLVTLHIEGTFVSSEGINWDRCEPEDAELCTLARFFESLSPPMEDIPLQGESNLFLHTGSFSSHTLSGFLIWPMQIEQTLNLCPFPVPAELPLQRGSIYAK